MKDLKWSDNVCTVGWTCVHAGFTPAQMNDLKTLCPKGDFTVTFLSDFPIRSAKDAEKHLKTHPYSNGVIYTYFTFPLDKNGVSLLKLFGFDPKKARFWHRGEIGRR